MAKTSSNAAPDNLMVLLVPIEDCQLILPDAAVAEIVEFQPTEAASDALPTWYLGRLRWRGLDVPLVSLEGINHNAFFTRSRNLKIIIMHGLAQRDRLPFWAFVAMETPRMSRIEQERLQPMEQEELRQVEKMWCAIDGEPVMIPDLAKIEQQIVALADA